MSHLGLDVYQLTTLAAHSRLGRLDQQVAMAFFFRKLPKNRNYVLAVGLRQILDWCEKLALDDHAFRVMQRNRSFGPLLAADPDLAARLQGLSGFQGTIEAIPEGTPAFAGPGLTTAGEPLMVAETRLNLYTPLLQARTDMVRAKLLETPWLSRLNHLSMVATKASRVVLAASGRPVLEFGQRRTHPQAAIETSYAAYIGGCAGTSNLAAEERYGVPASGTMDHFAVQASERPGQPPQEGEREFFETLVELMPQQNTLLVDTYDTEKGLRQAAIAGGSRLTAIRLDSSVTPDAVRQARRILDEAGAPQAKIFVSDGLDEWRVADLVKAGADGFGVGENIACSPDSATGVGAVGKLVENGYGRMTMKFSRGSGKATLPGRLQVYRFDDHDLLALAGEPAKGGGRPLLKTVWQGDRPTASSSPPEETRSYARRQIESLPKRLRRLDVADEPWPIVASDALVDLVNKLAKEASI